MTAVLAAFQHIHNLNLLVSTVGDCLELQLFLSPSPKIGGNKRTNQPIFVLMTSFSFVLAYQLFPHQPGLLVTNNGKRLLLFRNREEILLQNQNKTCCTNIAEIAKRIIDLSVHGQAQNQSYDRLATFTDKYGYRLAGTKNLENAIGK